MKERAKNSQKIPDRPRNPCLAGNTLLLRCEMDNMIIKMFSFKDGSSIL